MKIIKRRCSLPGFEAGNFCQIGEQNMKILEKISEGFGKYMAFIVLAVAALALFVPSSRLWINISWVNYLLLIVMFGMGLTM